MSPVGSKTIPAGGLRDVPRHTLAVGVGQPEVVTSGDVSLLSGEPEPEGCFLIALWHTIAVLIRNSQIMLCVGIALLGRRLSRLRIGRSRVRWPRARRRGEEEETANNDHAEHRDGRGGAEPGDASAHRNQKRERLRETQLDRRSGSQFHFIPCGRQYHGCPSPPTDRGAGTRTFLPPE